MSQGLKTWRGGLPASDIPAVGYKDKTKSYYSKPGLVDEMQRETFNIVFTRVQFQPLLEKEFVLTSLRNNYKELSTLDSWLLGCIYNNIACSSNQPHSQFKTHSITNLNCYDLIQIL